MLERFDAKGYSALRGPKRVGDSMHERDSIPKPHEANQLRARMCLDLGWRSSPSTDLLAHEFHGAFFMIGARVDRS
jgi:hypothetical protein